MRLRPRGPGPSAWALVLLGGHRGAVAASVSAFEKRATASRLVFHDEPRRTASRRMIAPPATCTPFTAHRKTVDALT